MKATSPRKRRLSVLFLCLAISLFLLLSPSLLRERRERALLLTVANAAAEFDMPGAMVLAVIRTESNFDANAVSPAGAVGLMQLLPETFEWLYTEKLGEPLHPGDISAPAVNIRYGTYYLSYLYAAFGDWPIALAAYNAGEGRVREWLEDPVLSKDGVLRDIPFPETKAYVEQTMRAYRHYTEKYSL